MVKDDYWRHDKYRNFKNPPTYIDTKIVAVDDTFGAVSEL